MWFSKHKDITLKKTQRRLLAILILSVSILIAVGAIFTGFELELRQSLTSHTKEVVAYGQGEEINQSYQWLKSQSDVTQLQRYGQNIIRTSCDDKQSMALIMTDPKYKHTRALMSPLALKLLGDCSGNITLTSYDLNQLFPIPTPLTLPYTASAHLDNPIPSVIVSPEVFKKLGFNTDNNAMWLSFHVPKNKNVVLWLHHAGWKGLKLLDMNSWHENFSKAIASQKVMMWFIMGLLLISALFQLKHVLEDMLNQQRKFWSLMHIHGISNTWINTLFSLYIGGFIMLTIMLSIPLGISIAYSINPLIHGIEMITGTTVLDPQFFITDHVPVAISMSDILIIETIFCICAALFTLLALRKRQHLDTMKVLRNA